jgi:hypothetical protein
MLVMYLQSVSNNLWCIILSRPPIFGGIAIGMRAILGEAGRQVPSVEIHLIAIVISSTLSTESSPQELGFTNSIWNFQGNGCLNLHG